MKRLLKCHAGHVWIEPDEMKHDFQHDPHEGCGARLSSSQYIKPKDEKDIYHCKICGAPELAHYCEQIKTEMICGQLCFDCNFWQEKIVWRQNNRPDVYVINGHHYIVHPDANPDDRDAVRWSGHAGRKFVIKPKGRPPFETRNLWHQGEIPERFRNILTDSAEFIKDHQ
jgi:hypothetical protein